MRRFFSLLVLAGLMTLPNAAQAYFTCPKGAILNSFGMCSQSAALAREGCTENAYFDATTKQCQPRCPDGGEYITGPSGDYVCQHFGERANKDQNIKKCKALGGQYVPQVALCVGVPQAPAEKRMNENIEIKQDLICPEGKVISIRTGTCVKGDRKAMAAKLQQKLEKQGLTYQEYIDGMMQMQTNSYAVELLQHRLEELKNPQAAGATTGKTIYTGKIVNCPDQYVATEEGGFKPMQPCNIYRCPDNSVPKLQAEGKNFYCGCGFQR